jgi:hypothetical protein
MRQEAMVVWRTIATSFNWSTLLPGAISYNKDIHNNMKVGFYCKRVAENQLKTTRQFIARSLKKRVIDAFYILQIQYMEIFQSNVNKICVLV